MHASNSTFIRSCWLIAIVLGALAIMAAGPVRGDDKPTSPPPPPPKEEKPKEPKDQLYMMKFMGTIATGKRFCIIADASDSMNGGGKLAQLKKEMAKTLDGLDPASQFCIIFFNKTDIPMPFPGWLEASKENVGKVKPWVDNMRTHVNTWPQSSFDRAFKMQPNPDVIFFMTDGFLRHKPDPVTQLAKLNAAEPKVVVHTIMFTHGNKLNERTATQLRTVAEKNGGTFRHVVHEGGTMPKTTTCGRSLRLWIGEGNDGSG